jgi:hypothetical protein
MVERSLVVVVIYGCAPFTIEKTSVFFLSPEKSILDKDWDIRIVAPLL